ncbi:MULTISPECIES: ATP-dependent DNA helicase [Halococcus]|uniref:DNA repair helicase n=1 Tax=Halococcus salifodinae DSM 8989 TaxID=1227456 RepID=M0N6D6_9EURY|nr:MULTISPECIES: ATP-dependent DNA helicase [Halococcus]EMA53431.1 DNA repair helicase [Halococcus salifodinae DSM 8989]
MSGDERRDETAVTGDGTASHAAEGDRESEHDWHGFFGYEEPYANQADAIEAAIDAGEEGGYLVMEGACGTGKTMAALAAAGHLLRNTDRYDNVVVATPVKQQRRQFIQDLRAINADLDEPFAGLALVGKPALCPYERADAFDRGVQDACEDLRETTAGLVAGDDGGEAWWDAGRAAELVDSAKIDADSWRTLDEGLSTAGVDAPYSTGRPAAPEAMTESDREQVFCPFEADWYAREKGSPVSFADGESGVVTTEELLAGAVPAGTCPHRAMGALLEDADVVVGNYNHLFDPRTRVLTDGVVDERTFVIVDEAHRLEGRVRDLLSDRIGSVSLRRARNDVAQLASYARQSRENREAIASQLASWELSTDALAQTREFYDDAIDWLDRRVESHLDEEFDDLDRAAERGDLPERTEIPLRDPAVDEPDDFTEWAAEAGYSEAFCESLHTVGAAVEDVLETVDPDRSCVCGSVGRLMRNWWTNDHAAYFREVTLERTDREHSDKWRRHYTAALECYDCLPAADLRERFADLGGGVLMSATLEPMDVFRECVGLDRLVTDSADGADAPDAPDIPDVPDGVDLQGPKSGDGDGGAANADGEAAGAESASDEHSEVERPITERTYDLTFPAANRASWIVDVPAFTARNRGPPDSESEVRETYAYALREIAQSPGNVLVCMPSYREAAWAAERLAESVAKPVLVDEPSSAETTEALKRDFFADDGKVLVTSTRGTLTEGVDYDGAKLSACAVVGVPLVNVASPRIRAVRRAYGAAFGEDKAFEYALTVPAVRRARQAIGRVIRGPEEVGVRAFLDERYTLDAPRSVHEYLPSEEREEWTTMTPMFLEQLVEEFAEEHPEWGYE